jgi:hypothetical protein
MIIGGKGDRQEKGFFFLIGGGCNLRQKAGVRIGMDVKKLAERALTRPGFDANILAC